VLQVVEHVVVAAADDGEPRGLAEVDTTNPPGLRAGAT